MSDHVEKIKKLLRLGQSPNPHEAALAMARALEIANRYKIDLAGLDLEDDLRKLVHEYFPIGWRLSLIKKRTLQILQAYFNVNVVLCNPRVCFIGTQSDVEIAHYVFAFLARAGEKNLRRFKQAHPRARKNAHDNFVCGFFWGISHKLGEARQQFEIQDGNSALILAEDARREAKEKELFRDLAPVVIDKPKTNHGAVMAGWIEGKKVEITPAVASSGSGTKLLA